MIVSGTPRAGGNCRDEAGQILVLKAITSKEGSVTATKCPCAQATGNECGTDVGGAGSRRCPERDGDRSPITQRRRWPPAIPASVRPV